MVPICMVPEFSFFSDTIRDAVRGSMMDTSLPGFVSGGKADKTLLHACFMGMPDWAPNPIQSVNYVSCHDNNTLIDRISIAVPQAPYDVHVKMNNLAAAFTMLSQGVPFFQAGEEMLRTKPDGNGGVVENSYNAPDFVNSIRWDRLNEPLVMQTYRYYQGLIAFRKAHACLRNTTRQAVMSAVKPANLDNPHAVAFTIHGENEELIALFNASIHSQTIILPPGKWAVCINGEKAGTETITVLEGSATAEAISAMVLVKIA